MEGHKVSDIQNDRIKDTSNLLDQKDHMRDMERVSMEIIALHQPFRSVTRVVGRIQTETPDAWCIPNLALRIEVEPPQNPTPDTRPITRIYTVRSFDPETQVLEIDFVRHKDNSPAMRWLNSITPGAHVSMIGPRTHFVPPFTAGKQAALFADDTAIPAVYAILNAWPAGVKGAVWIDTDTPAACDELPAVDGVEIHLLQRSSTTRAGTANALFTAATTALPDPAGWTLWAAGERQEMRRMRNHFFALGMAREDLQILGYWRAGTSSSELDRMRLAQYEQLRAQNKTLEDLNDADLPI